MAHLKPYSRILLILLLTPIFGFAEEKHPKPFIIPEIKEWIGAEGMFMPGRKSGIVFAEEALQGIAEQLAADYEQMFGEELAVSRGKGKKGDIILQLSEEHNLGEEGYRMEISDRVRLTAPTPTGIFWATRTLLQLAEQQPDQSMPRGVIKDFPDYPFRGFMLDCARKFFPLHFLEDYVRMMAYYKMNVFHIHLNDNGFKQYFDNDWNKTYAAFRLESETFPGLTARDGHYSKKEFIALQQLAELHFVEIIPEIDVPAHSLAFAHYKPEVGSEEYGMDHLDLFQPETYTLLDALFKEYLEGEEPVFRGPRVHIGTDEYSNRKKEVVEKFRYFTDYYIRLVESYGKQACIWGAQTHAAGETPIKAENVLMWLWHNPYAEPDSMLSKGYQLVSIPDGLLYIVPNAGYYYDYLNTSYLYDHWTPAHIGKQVYPEKDPRIPGGMFAVWNDHVGNGISSKDVHHRVLPAMQTLAVKMWTGATPAYDYATFNCLRSRISEAPGVNISGKTGHEPAQVYQLDTLPPDYTTGLREIGYDYTISFTLQGRQEEKNTLLFSSPDATFYLSDPIRGLLGFARDGYLYTFNYSVKENEAIRITLCGDSKSTRLYLNDRLHQELAIQKLWFNEGKSSMNYIQTLVFPLERSGTFTSAITNLQVYNYCRDR